MLVQVQPLPTYGDIAQKGEHLLCKQRVAGSSPAISTNEGMIVLRTIKAARFFICFVFISLFPVMLSSVQNVKESAALSDLTSTIEFTVSTVTLSQKPLAASQTSSVVSSKPEPQPYIYEMIPFDEEMQLLVWQACEETGCPYELALSVIWNESMYQNLTGDNGNSIGYMQIQPRWHQARMERLGVSDLSDPLSNFRVGCDLLAELLDRYSLKEALTCYNTGSPGQSRYADGVVKYMEDTLSK